MPNATDDPYRGQSRAHIYLGEVIAVGRRSGLPPLTWTVTAAGALTGEAGAVDYSPEEQEAAVHRWAARLRADVDTRTDADGTRRLSGPWKAGADGPVIGCLRATVPPIPHA